MTRNRARSVTHVAAVALAVLSVAALAPACKRDKGYDRDREEQRVVVDTGQACVLVGGGDPSLWATGTYVSDKFQQLQKLARMGDATAGCDAAKIMRKHGKQTRTCTARTIAALHAHACGE